MSLAALTKLAKGSWLLAAFPLLSLTFASRGQQPKPYEALPTLRASEIVPATLLSGPHHRVDEQVTTDGFMNHFTIHSDFGEFVATSERMLRVRVNEVAAIAQLQELSRTDAFAGALKSSAVGTVKTVEQVVTNPVETAQGLPSGINRAARGLYYKSRKVAHKADAEIDEYQEQQAAEAEAEGGSEGKASTSEQAKELSTEAAKKYSGYSAAKRELAMRLKVDPYSTNPVLQKELTRLAQAAMAANLGFKMVVPSSRFLGYVGDVAELVWKTSPTELERLNNKALADLGLAKDLRLGFFASPAFTPTTQTLLVESLKRMAPAENRGIFIELGAGLETEEDAWLLATAAQILASYHGHIKPLVRLVLVGNDEVGLAPAAITTAERAVVPVPFDHVTWQAGLDVRGPLYEIENRELWLAGRISERAKGELEARGFTVNERVLELFARLEQEAR